MPVISIIIPLYNKEAFVVEALQSVLKQTVYQEYNGSNSGSNFSHEIILVDDASTDNSVAHIEPFLSEGIRLVQHAENKGLSATRNQGIASAKGEWITYIDADDYWEPTFLEKIQQLIDAYPNEQVFATNYVEWMGDELRNPVTKALHWPKNVSQLLPDVFAINRTQGLFVHSGICLHRNVYQKVGLYDEGIRFAEDLDFNIRCFLQHHLVFWNAPLVRYRMGVAGQMTETSLRHKTIPDYNKYKEACAHRTSLKAYLNFERYVLAKHLKIDGDARYHSIVEGIDSKHLNAKQRLLLACPRPVLRLIKAIKNKLQTLGINTSSY